MVRIKPFKGIRPPQELAKEVASRPYDVLNSAEAKAEATERSLLHIIKPEIDFEPIADEHSQEVYDKAVENFAKWRNEGWLQQDGDEHYYIYAQTMDGRTQYGLAMCCHFEDYLSGAIKKHELTRTDKGVRSACAVNDKSGYGRGVLDGIKPCDKRAHTVSEKYHGKCGIGLVQMLVKKVDVLDDVLVGKVTEVVGSRDTLAVTEVVVTRKNNAARAKEARKLGVSRGVVYHTVRELNYSARRNVLRSIYLRINRVFTVG